MTSEITVVTPENVELKFELAGLGSRFVAVLIDSTIQILITAALALAIFLSLSGMPNWAGRLSVWVIAIFALLLFALWSGYFLFFEAARNGQTPGKKSVGIRVIRDSGHPLDFRSAILRNLMRAVDGQGLYAVGFLSVFLSPQYRRLGDYVAGTLVVKTQQKVKPSQEPSSAGPQVGVPWPKTPSASAAAPLFPAEVMSHLGEITKDDYRAVRHFLDRRSELEPQVARTLAIKLMDPLARKLQMDAGAIENPIGFLQDLSREWERRMIH